MNGAMAVVQNPSNPAPHVVVQGQPEALPVQLQVVAQQPATIMVQNPNTSEAYNATSAKVTGWMQLSCAIACIVIGIIEIIVGSLLGFVGTGIWSGLLFMLPTGILGIVSQNKNTCVIMAYMVMSIISALDGGVVFSMGITSALVGSDPYSLHGYEGESVRIAFCSLLTITGLIEIIVAIVAAGFCCASVCCGRTTSSVNTIMTAVQYPSNPAPHVAAQGQPGAPPDQDVDQQPATVTEQNPNTSEAYNATSAKVTGWMQLSCAIACMVFGTIEIFFGSPLSFVGTGVWGGLFLILPTGILGIVSQNKNTCVIAVYMVLSIISAPVGVAVTALAISVSIRRNDPSFISFLYDYETWIAFDSLLAITGLLELIVAIVAACYCCAAVCCGRTTSSANTPTMVYHQQGNVIPMVMMVPAYGQPVIGQEQPATVSQPEGH